MPKTIQNLYGNRVRIRVCGICVVDDKILMVNHVGLGNGNLWSPPGGGIELNESSHQAVEREIREETNLTVRAKELLFVSEFIKTPLHALELFFKVDLVGGHLKLGEDPEMESGNQLIAEARYFTWEEIKEMDPTHVHGIFKYASEPSQILDLRGYFKL